MSRNLPILLAISLLLPPGLGVAAGRDTDVLFRAGLRAYLRGDYSQAMQDFMDVLLLDPDYLDAKVYLKKANKRAEADEPQGKGEASVRAEGTRVAPPSDEGAAPSEDIESLRAERRRLEAAREALAEERLKLTGERKRLEEAKAARCLPTPAGAAKGGAKAGPEEPRPRRSRVQAERLYRRGVSAYAREDVTAAMRLWKEALRSDPGHARARRALQRARKEKTP